MTNLIVILTFVGILRVSAVDIIEDKYTASYTPRKLDISSRQDGLIRVRRDAGPDPSPALNYTDVYLQGTEQHKEAYMHWSGTKNNLIYILTRSRGQSGEIADSKLWQSKDYGSSYQNVTARFGKGALITFFYVSPADKTRLIFADTTNKRLYITIDEMKTIKTINLTFSPDRLIPNPTNPDSVLGYTLEQRKLFVSTDFGKKWVDFHEAVTPRVFWGDASYDNGSDIVHLEVQSSNGEARYKNCSINEDCRKKAYESSVGSFDSFSMLVINEYIFVQKTTVFESIMHVSYKRGEFRRAYFPPVTNTKDFLIVNADEGQVFIAVNHLSTSNLYLSDATGQFYTLTLSDTAFLPQPRWFDVEIYEVKGINGTYIANQRKDDKSKTLISFDKGGKWKPLPLPETLKGSKQCTIANCSLHLDIRNWFGPGILSESNAPGLLMAHGNIGSHLVIGDKHRSVFVSRDGGWKWNKTSLAPSLYRFNILDQGSVMTAIEDAFIQSTNTVHYSLDEGKTWNKTDFLGDKNITVDGVLNEPGITTLISSVYGHESHGSVWAVVKLNFSSILNTKCDKTKDYETWKPTDQIAKDKCILGSKIMYERRKQLSKCYNGGDYERAVNHTNCLCEEEDFECDYGYLPSGEHDCTKASWFTDASILNECPEGQLFNKSQGYRKIASDKCTAGISGKNKYKPVATMCPTIKPGGLTISSSQPIAATNSEVVFSLTQEKGSKLSTNYTWSFNDSTANVVRISLKNSSVKHMFSKFGMYIVTVVAQNKNGSSVKSLQHRVEDKITDSIVSVSWATRVRHVTDFDIDVYGPLVHNNQAHIHFLWTFGDEEGLVRPVLSWDRRVQHAYNKSGNYSITVEAINSVSTVFKRYTIQVFDNGSIVRLSFTPNAERFHFDQKIYTKIMFLQLLKQTFYLHYGLRTNRVEVHLHSMNPVQADVLLLPSTSPQDEKVDDVIASIKKDVASQSLEIPMNGRTDVGHIIRVTDAQLVNDSSAPTPETHGPNLRAVYIAIPVLACAGIVTLLVLVYYKKKFRESRRYSILRQRSDSDALLGGDDEDDPPLDLNPDFGTSERADDDQLDLGTGSHLVMVTGRGDGGDNSVNC